jgi:hypothetical protein
MQLGRHLHDRKEGIGIGIHHSSLSAKTLDKK